MAARKLLQPRRRARREKGMESYARARAERSGALVLKLWPTRAGLPDRLVLVKNGQLAFVEWKTATGRVSPVQARVLGQLRALGFRAVVVRSQQEFNEVVDRLRLQALNFSLSPRKPT